MEFTADLLDMQAGAGDGRVERWLGGEREAVAIRGTEKEEAPLTYGALREEIEGAPRVADAVGERVAVIVPREEGPLCASVLLCVMAQCSACPLDSSLAVEQLRAAAKQLGCTTAVVGESVARDVRRAKIFRTVVVVTQGVASGAIRWSTSGAPHEPEDGGALGDPGRQVLVLRTSGTTSQPKVVPLTAANMLFNARALARSLTLRPEDVCLSVMPLFHIGGISCNLLAVLISGSSVVCAPAFDAEEFVDWLEQLRPTWYYAVPTIHKALLMHLARTGRPVRSSLRLVRSGAAHLPHEDAEALHEAFGCPVLPTYSMSECMPVCATPDGYDLHARDSVGPPIGPSVRIVAIGAASADPLPFGEVGEVVVRGPGVMGGYEGSDGSEFLPGGWLRTGDSGTMDRRGWVQLKGRLKEMAKRGGEQISLHEVDVAARRLPAVEQAVSFAVANPFWGEEVAVAVVAKSGVAKPAPAALLAALRADLGAARGPSQVVLVSEADLARTKGATGKFKRGDMAQVLGVRCVDLPMDPGDAGPVRLDDKREEGADEADDEPLRPSKALYGLRFFTSLFVAQHHIGKMPNQGWAKVQTFTLNMTIFMLLAGYMLAASNQERVPASERVSFYVSRLSASHPVYLFALLLSLPAYFMVCYPGARFCGWEDGAGYYVAHILSLLAHVTGFHAIWMFGHPMFNGVTWFQTAYYVLVLLFPFIDSAGRRLPTLALWAVLLVLLVAASFVIDAAVQIGLTLQINFFSLAWSFAFGSGVLAWRIFERMHDYLRFRKHTFLERLAWGLFTDLITLAFLGAEVLVIMDESCSGYDCDILFGYYQSQGGRLASDLGSVLGFNRKLTALCLLWIYALSHGHGATAALFSSRPVVWLSALAYPLYLLHVPVAYYFWFATRGYIELPWLPGAAGFPFPVAFWELFVIVAIALFIGFLFNEFLNPRLIKYSTRFWRAIFGLLCCCCSNSTAPDEEPGPDAGTFGVVKREIRRLTGAVVSRDTNLQSIGLDSFGATALVGTLRAALPQHAKRLRPTQLTRLRTVGELANHLDDQLSPDV